MKRLLTLLLILACALATACGGSASTRAPKDDALTAYGASVRWSDFDSAIAFIDPSLRPAPGLTPEERDRFAKVKITGYEVKSRHPAADGSLEQTVEIRVVDQDTQKERVILDHQRWRADATGKVWMLTSGLPEL